MQAILISWLIKFLTAATALGVGIWYLSSSVGGASLSSFEGMALFLSRDLPQIWLLRPDGELCLIRDRIESDRFNGEEKEGCAF